MEAIILAGGFGTRLQSALPDLAKPMAPIGGRPFLELLLASLAGQSIDRVILSVGHRHEQIVSHFGDSYGPIQLEYAIEAEPLGTGGAIRYALSMVDSNPVFILNGDTFLRLDYAAMYARHQAASAMLSVAVTRLDDTSRYGSVVLQDDRITAFREKASGGRGLINAGVYCADQRLFEGRVLAEAFSFETAFLHPFVQELKPLAFVSEGYFIDIGVLQDLERARAELIAETRKGSVSL